MPTLSKDSIVSGIGKNYFDKEYFTNGYLTGKSGYDEKSFDISNDIFIKQGFMLYYILGLKNKTVLDIGCARCNLVKVLRNIGIKAYGVDISEWCKKNSYCTDTHICSDVSSGIPIYDNKLDDVVSFETFEHISKIEYVIKEIQRVLKPGGVFFATISSREHKSDPSGIQIQPESWWREMLSKYLIQNKELESRFNEDIVVENYKWSVYCYENKK